MQTPSTGEQIQIGEELIEAEAGDGQLSAEWSRQLAEDLFNPKIGFAPSANSDFFAQISLSTCSWVFRSHIFYFIIIFAQREHKV